MKLRVVFVIAAAAMLALTVTGVLAWQEKAQAQGGLPELRSIIYQGNVTIAGQPSPNGFRLTAKIRSATGQVLYTSPPAIVGRTVDSRYTALVVGPAPDVEGGVIEFWLDDQVRSTNDSVFAPIQNGQICLGCSWTLPILRTQDLNFPTAPIATPTPTHTPTPTPIILLPSLYSGQVLAGSSIPPDGTAIYAKVGTYTSPFSTIEGGRFQVVVNPVDEEFLGLPVVFFIGELRAVQSTSFKGNEFLGAYNLIFPTLPPTPTSTPVPPTPTPTPEPTRTPTPAPSPTPTATPTITPTPIGSGEPTSQVTPTQEPGDSDGGGFCSAHSGGPASTGMLGLFALPFVLWLTRRLRGSRFTAVHEEN